MELIRRFAPETLARAMDSWAWESNLRGKVPRFTSAFGDVFLQGEDGFWLLDVVGGTTTRRWSDGAALQADINNRATQEQILMPDLVAAVQTLGLAPSQTEILAFKVPPVLGGAIAANNIEVADFVVALDLAGQIHGQVKDLPPGTPITGISFHKR